MYAAAWICGEFCSYVLRKVDVLCRVHSVLNRYLKEPQETLQAILNTKVTLFPGHIQSVYYQNILKIVTHLIQSSNNDQAFARQLISTTIEKMSTFLSSGDVEAQERVCSVSFSTEYISFFRRV